VTARLQDGFCRFGLGMASLEFRLPISKSGLICLLM
jgi:hypothetical protein